MTRAAGGRRPVPPPAVLAVRGAAAVLATAGLGHTLWGGVHEPGHALAFGVLITVGELARWGALPGEREPAPLGAAGALAYALLGRSGGAPTTHGVLQVIAVLTAAQLVACVPQVARGSGPAPDRVTRRILTVTFAAVCFQPLYNSGRVPDRFGEGPYYVLFMLLLLALTALCDAVLAALLLRSRTGHPYGPLLRDELRALIGIGSAVCATGVVMALGVAVAGLWALPVLCVPLLLTQVSFRRFVAVRTTYRQTITSLARSTEIAGYTPPGHARRVATLCTAVGRELGLSGSELTVLEYAALMHDIGQLSLVDPVPDGATAALPTAEQRRIALLGGAVVRQTGVDAEVAVVVERQADPYREQPLSARIVRAVNAYDDLCGESLIGPLGALEQLRLGTGHDYQPEVVESLARVLARGGLTPVPPG
ncbi:MULTISPECIES: HD-GYP domain-containing protein [unclassified Streptomyces]|uniref:HD-GYP domain-containing protein n=1 Tax=unclassified Streptomyces TaxID=2593676 RepID=UPI00225B8B5E|nr:MULTISPECIES: HD domain-containing protein [unclassified Streptomyces]WSP57412.1 metal-dependent phosphohydrolase [Streptomyces sp. NBC_01241]WSU21852.1 metal-dependent phosphohydrolase [Streptomyces sp. NBC_01108]MCX4789255.1 metal-dependent phosphohydrolase [Streptomyces sp. NBC_01221]MCX4795019.1 metal-dependent phosphohydrolase [Streptomyces sp. NBC_01242]WSJ36309.1 metal-dependent phosphohydrolase [Streptomyces sp. NBC_01321]